MVQRINSNRVRVKICGITRVEDLLAAYQAGADAVGFVFYEKSPRSVSIPQAKMLLKQCPPFMTTVGLFVNAKRSYINSVLREVPLDVLQFHGDETNNECIAYDKPFIKAIRVTPEMDLTAKIMQYPDTMAVLLDSYVPGVEGGTGVKFNWDLIPKSSPKPIILAGGLNPENVASAISQTYPCGVDVSGGVEVNKGIKDQNKIRVFIQEVNHASN